MEEVLSQNSDHSMRSNPDIESGETDPKTNNSFISDALLETVEETSIRFLSIRTYMIRYVPFFCFIIFVFTLSKGKVIKAMETPEIADATNLVDIDSVFSLVKAWSNSLDWLYETN